MTVMGTGKVLVWKDREAYGFISPDQPGLSSGRDIFFHAIDVEDPQVRRINARVAFEVIQSERGYQAVKVKLDGEQCTGQPLTAEEWRQEFLQYADHIYQQMVQRINQSSQVR